MRVRVEVIGADQLRADLKRLGPLGKVAARDVFAEELPRWLPEMKANTPVEPEDGGQLRDSIRVTKPTITKAGRVSAGIVAGGAPLKKVMGNRKANVYAVIQHEDASLKHSVGGAKFVEKTFMRRVGAIPGLIQAALDRVMKARSAPSGDFEGAGI